MGPEQQEEFKFVRDQVRAREVARNEAYLEEHAKRFGEAFARYEGPSDRGTRWIGPAPGKRASSAP